MSTDLKSRSKAYDLTRTSLRGIGNVGVIIGTRHMNSTLSIPEIENAFATGDWSVISHLDLFDETVDRLKVDLAQFALSKGDGMERDYFEYTAETYCVITSGETGWCVKFGDDNVCDVYAGEKMARRIAEALNNNA